MVFPVGFYQTVRTNERGGVLLGYHKINTTAYHPQTDGLVERYNRTLTSMLAKTVSKSGPEWEEQLSYALFTYPASQQASTQKSPFYLFYGRDPRLPVPNALSPQQAPTIVNLQEYGIQLHAKMSSAWELACKCVVQAHQRQKTHYDPKSTVVPFRASERVFLYKPVEKTGEARKLARLFHGPYRVIQLDKNTATIRHVDRPEKDPLLVSIDRLRCCPTEIGLEFWPPDKSRKKSTRGSSSVEVPTLSDDGPLLAQSDTEPLPMPAEPRHGDSVTDEVEVRQPEEPCLEPEESTPDATSSDRLSTIAQPDVTSGLNDIAGPSQREHVQDSMKWSGRIRTRRGPPQRYVSTVHGAVATLTMKKDHLVLEYKECDQRGVYDISKISPMIIAIEDDWPQQGEM